MKEKKVEVKFKEASRIQEMINLLLQFKWQTVNKHELRLIDGIIKLLRYIESEGKINGN